MTKEIDDGEREMNARKATATGKANGKAVKPTAEISEKDHRKLRKEITNIERKIARLDEQKRELNGKLLTTTDPDEALRLHNEIEALGEELGQAEERWCELNGT